MRTLRFGTTLLFAALTALFPFAKPAYASGPDVPVLYAADQAHSAPSMVSSPTMGLWMVRDNSSNDCMDIVRSTDGGHTWSQWFWFCAGGAVAAPHSHQPSILVPEAEDYVYILHRSANNTELKLLKIQIATLAYTWTTVATVPNGGDWISSPKIVSDSSNYGAGYFLYITYATSGAYSDFIASAMFARSLDKGVTWTTPTYMGRETPDIAWGNYKLYLSWSTIYYGGGDIYVIASANWGSTWGSAVNLTDVTTRSVQGPKIAVSGTTVLIAYNEDFGTYPVQNYDVSYAYSTDAGATWQKNYHLPGSTTASEFVQGVAVDASTGYPSSGSFYLIYTQSNTGVMYSTAHSLLSWSYPAQMNDPGYALAGTATIALDRQGLQTGIAWDTATNGIFFDRPDFPLPPPPSNDLVSKATIIPSALPINAPVVIESGLDTRGAGIETSDPTPTCVGPKLGKTVWYKYTPTAAGMLYVDTKGSNYDTVVAIYTGSPGAFANKACEDDWYSYQSSAGMAVVAGTTYTIMVGGYGYGPGGSLVLRLTPPEIKTTPALTFPVKQVVGTTSTTPLKLTVSNYSNQAMTFAAPPAYLSPNFTLVPAGTLDCAGKTLAAKVGTTTATCQIWLNFTPTNPGAIKGGLTIYASTYTPTTTNGFKANNTGYVVSLNGTAVNQLAFSTAALALGTVPIGSTSAIKSATLYNYSNSDAFFTLGTSGNFTGASNCPISGTTYVPAAIGATPGSCIVTASFTPTRALATKGALWATTTTGITYVLNLSGTGSGMMATYLNIPATTFTAQLVNTTSAAKTITLKNTSTATTAHDVVINSLSVSPPFALVAGSNYCTGTLLHYGNTCTVQVAFSPKVISSGINGALTVRSNDPTGTQIGGITGVAVPAITFTPATLTFASQLIGTTSAQKTVTLKNTSSVPVTLTFTASGSYSYSTGTCSSTLNAGTTCTMNIRFLPLRNGATGGSFGVYASGMTSSPFLLPLSGTGN